MKVRIAIGQLNVTVGALGANCTRIIESINKAKKQKADIVVFPELTLSGYPPEDLLHKQHFLHDNIKYSNKVAQATFGNIVSVVGFPYQNKGQLYNAAAINYKKTTQNVYCKIKLPNYGVFDEKRYFSSGTHCSVIIINGIRVGITICEDIWNEDDIVSYYSMCANVDIIINLSASPYHAGKLEERFKLIAKLAKKFNIHIVYANMIGGQDELVFDGGSFVVDDNGQLKILGNEFEEDFLITDIEIFELITSDKVVLQDKYVFSEIVSTSIKKIVEVPVKIIRKDPSELLKDKKSSKTFPIQEIYSALKLGLKDYIRKNNFQKVVLGLSGGIDSALTALIAVDALGKENVICVSLPTEFSSNETRSDIVKIASNLDVELMEISIQGLYEHYLETLEPVFNKRSIDVTEENIQARIRGTLLMSLSNKFGWIVLSTGNKSEMAVGYATLYGDMAGGFSVLKDVPKTLVYKLVRYCNKKSGINLIPLSVLKRPPSAELRYNQKDEDELPPYEVLDAILDLYVEKDYSLKEILRNNDFSQKDVKKIINMIDKNEYKRRQASPGIRITPKAFGKDRRIPITNKYRG